MRSKNILLFISLFVLSKTVMAEGGCPPGSYPANPPATNICYPLPESQNSTPAPPKGRWVTRWGAIAIDNTVSNGGFGAVVNAKNKSAAVKAAIAQCRASGGGSGCKVKVSYYNQCAVVAWGDTSYSPSSGPNIDETSQRAMKNCSIATTNCKIYYADCTTAQWVE